MRLAWCKHKRRLKQSFGKYFSGFLFHNIRKIAVFFPSAVCAEKRVL